MNLVDMVEEEGVLAYISLLEKLHRPCILSFDYKYFYKNFKVLL